MKTKPGDRHFNAFTLIELLVVIAIIGILAALILPVTGALKKKATLARTQTQLSQLETAIDQYKQKYNFYPPDSTNNPAVNQLFYELTGTSFNEATKEYQTLDGSSKIAASALPGIFGANVDGFSNSSAGKGSEEGTSAQNFLSALKSGQTAESTISGVSVRLLIGPAPWPLSIPAAKHPVPTQPGLNPWRYDSSNPTNNVNSYDLWIDLVIGGKTNRISNWRKDAEIVYWP